MLLEGSLARSTTGRTTANPTIVARLSKPSACSQDFTSPKLVLGRSERAEQALGGASLCQKLQRASSGSPTLPDRYRGRPSRRRVNSICPLPLSLSHGFPSRQRAARTSPPRNLFWGGQSERSKLWVGPRCVRSCNVQAQGHQPSPTAIAADPPEGG